jgi:hypothetical protein
MQNLLYSSPSESSEMEPKYNVYDLQTDLICWLFDTFRKCMGVYVDMVV